MLVIMSMNKGDKKTLGWVKIDDQFAAPNSTYDGTVPLIEGLICASCGAGDSKKNRLLRCTRCCLADYCSKECQREHFKSHRGVCKEVGELQGVANKSPAELIAEAAEPEQLFDGPQAMINLNYAYQIMASQKYGNTKLIYERALENSLDLMPIFLTPGDFPLPSFDKEVMFVLLHLNRDDDAMSYCCAQMLGSYGSLDDLAETIKKGEPIIPSEDAAAPRYQDILAQIPNGNIDVLPLHYLMGVFIVKLRLHAKYSRLKTVASMKSEELEPDIQTAWDEQRDQLFAISSRIDEKNAHLLPALLDHTPLLPQTAAGMKGPPYAEGSPEEAREIMLLSINLVRRIPGSEAWLECHTGMKSPYK